MCMIAYDTYDIQFFNLNNTGIYELNTLEMINSLEMSDEQATKIIEQTEAIENVKRTKKAATQSDKNDFVSRIDKRHLTWCHSASVDQLHACFSVGIPASKYIEDKLPSEKTFQVDPAVKIGDIGEMYVANILRTRYGENSVIVTSACSASADMHLSVYSGGRETNIMIEVKNYTASVATLQIEKFRRDISLSSHCAGLFVSLSSTITRMDEFNIIYEKNANRLIPCVYLHSSDPNMICTSIAILLNLSKANDDLSNFSGNRSAEIRDNLNVITKMREELNVVTSSYFSKIGKINTEIACAQSNISRLMRDDFTSDVIFNPNLSFCAGKDEAARNGGQQNEKNEKNVKNARMFSVFENYYSYSQDVREILSNIVELIEKQTIADINGVAKRIQKNNLVYGRTMITFNKIPTITIDTKEKTIDSVDYVTMMNLGATLTSEYVNISVNVATFDIIAKILI